MKKFFLFICLDQITKVIFTARDFFIPGSVIGRPAILISNGIFSWDRSFGPFHIRPLFNRGLSFGVSTSSIVSTILVSVVIVWLLVYAIRNRASLTSWQRTSLLMVFAGAGSNLLDRVFFGFVRDWLDIGLNFTFNLADVVIVAGLVIFMLAPSLPKWKGEQMIQK